MKKLEFHPASEVFRLLEGAELKSMRDSLEKFGQQVSIKVLDGKIIDGRNRYNCCLSLKIEPWLEHVTKSDMEGMSPLDYVRAMNEDRRHDDPGQRAMAAARIKEYYEVEAKERQGHRSDIGANLPESSTGRARDKAGEAMGVSGRTVDAAVKVLHHAAPEIVEAVEKSEVSVSDAAAVATLPKPKQKAALKKVKSGKAKTLKAAAEPHQKNGKQKKDPRRWARWEAVFGQLKRATDEMNKEFPHANFCRQVQQKLNETLELTKEWRRAVREPL
jgi:hypothetical protein